MSVMDRFKSLGDSRKGGVLAVLLAVLATLLWVQLEGGSLVKTGYGHLVGVKGNQSVHPKTGVGLHASLSQPMIVQGGDGTVYLDLSVMTPRTIKEILRVPTDTIIVLDRSGSMGEDSKWIYATQAVHSLLDRLTQKDRIAMISFDSGARVESPLVWANEINVQRLRSVVNALHPGASTNMGEALLFAENMAEGSASSERKRRVILLSDGQANTGIVSPDELSAIARRIADRGSIVSTIGMGLGFNETLMALLADHGMGSFSYLEHLESLGSILARELADSRDVYADGSEVRIHLPRGVQLVDAAGYPFVLEGRTAVIRTGQLFQDSTKRFMATLNVANGVPAEYVIDGVDLSYRVNGHSYQQQVVSDGLTIVCVPQEKEEEVVASIDKNVYEDAWIRNNLGSAMKKVADFVRTGRREQAQQAMEEYRSRLEEADQAVPGLMRKAESQLKELGERVDEAFKGRDQGVKQNRAAKTLLDDSQELQREVKRKAN